MRRVMLWKQKGETPLMALNAWRRAHPRYKDTPATYAGRLDPMAQGKLLILLGEECKKRERYLKLDKEYEVEVLFDIGSDTADALGLASYAGRKTKVDRMHLEQALKRETGAHVRAYPAYSSKAVNGKPLFQHALEGSLSVIEIPTHVERIYGIRIREMRALSSKALKEYVEAFLAKVPSADESSKRLGADFRIADVRAAWQGVFADAQERTFGVVTLTVSCASGAYMRSLAERLGSAFGTKALALSIKRTNLGRRFLGLWWL